MKKVEKKELTIKDLEELWNKHANASEEEKKELWKNEGEDNKIMLSVLRNTKLTSYKVITDKLVVDDIWAKDVEMLNYGLRKYNIKEFIFKDTSTQAMEILIRFLNFGWEVSGTEDWAIEEKMNYTEHKRYYEPKVGIVLKKKES